MPRLRSGQGAPPRRFSSRVKLLLDANLSFRLLRRLESVFPGSQHVGRITLPSRTDHSVWDYAGFHKFVIVSKDNDFRQLSFLNGPPPKVVWLSIGNAGTDAIGDLLLRHQSRIAAFEEDPEEGLLVLELAEGQELAM
jgi:predicted nuclease of predicted toxin-antitoxin system